MFYEWGANPADVRVSKAALITAVSRFFEMRAQNSQNICNIVDSTINDVIIDSAQVCHLRDCFDAYLSVDSGESVQSRVIGRKDIQDWLVPPVAPIPLLVESILANKLV